LDARFEIEGRVYEYDGKITVEDAIFIHEKSGLGMAKFNKELMIELNPLAIAAWMYLLKRRAGEAVRWQDIMKLDLRTFNVVFDEPNESEEEAEGTTDQADPTTSGETQKSATSST
jgi:hypothetical protein